MSDNKHKYRTPLATARGLGSAKDGVNHWVWQRLTAIIVAPLALWFLFSMISFTQDATSFHMVEWMRNPLNAMLSFLLVGALFSHAKLGVQVIIEDYVHNNRLKIISLIFIKLTFLIAGLISVMSIFSLHFMV